MDTDLQESPSGAFLRLPNGEWVRAAAVESLSFERGDNEGRTQAYLLTTTGQKHYVYEDPEEHDDTLERLQRLAAQLDRMLNSFNAPQR
ncbi:hypothetical protein [Deinococcus multiflagellatus]|uniref:Uncharacterized protein n=1 Tax=Deinococcus multiflagellatus TaxID=1656887 RepID=A0ABW1ZHY5_9DEIO|nr:hypothetical protein [Deinococcus multiflagellatus]MBZ9713764.1 hypothetical protein [Deinococcus multiflagellatus]